ncbi:MAG: enoyl-CoA hydratase/isomerase family protein [Candidatus Nanopelagicales bacterium]
MSGAQSVAVGDAALRSPAGLRVDRDGAVVTITIDRPDSRNSQTPALWRELVDVANSFGPETRAVILQGSGSAFSAGLDRAMFAQGIPGEQSLLTLADQSAQDFSDTIATYQRAFTCWRELDAITVAAVQGYAIGAGFQLALGADMMVVAEDVQLSMKETQLGLVPDLGGTKPLIQAVGYSRALEICASGRWLGAEEAVASGIAVASSPVPELAERAQALVASMLSAPPNALIEAKKLLRDADLRTRAQQCEQERDAQRRRITELATLVKGQ